MKTRFLTMILMALLLVAGEATAQSMSHSVSGVVRDAQTGKRLGQASVTADEGHDATVTNSDGYFVLKTQEPAKVLHISCLGYETAEVRLKEGQDKELKIRQSTKMIGESLEQHCLNEFRSVQADAYPNAFFGNCFH